MVIGASVDGVVTGGKGRRWRPGTESAGAPGTSGRSAHHRPGISPGSEAADGPYRITSSVVRFMPPGVSIATK